MSDWYLKVEPTLYRMSAYLHRSGIDMLLMNIGSVLLVICIPAIVIILLVVTVKRINALRRISEEYEGMDAKDLPSYVKEMVDTYLLYPFVAILKKKR